MSTTRAVWEARANGSTGFPETRTCHKCGKELQCYDYIFNTTKSDCEFLLPHHQCVLGPLKLMQIKRTMARVYRVVETQGFIEPEVWNPVIGVWEGDDEERNSLDDDSYGESEYIDDELVYEVELDENYEPKKETEQ